MKTDCPNCKTPMQKLHVNHPLDHWCEKCNTTSLYRDYTNKENTQKSYNDRNDKLLDKIYILLAIIAFFVGSVFIIGLYFFIKNR